jgi:hypothetical protein
MREIVYRHEREIGNWAVERFVKSTADINVLAIVLTVRQAIKRGDGTWQLLDQGEIAKLARKIVGGLNRRIFRNAYRRKRKNLLVLCSCEGKVSRKNLHLNFAIGIPSGRTAAELIRALEEIVPRLRWIEGRRYSAEMTWDTLGWASYISKEPGALLLDQCNLASP